MAETEEPGDMELGETLETALALNRAYQEVLVQHLETLKLLLEKNREKQVS